MIALSIYCLGSTDRAFNACGQSNTVNVPFEMTGEHGGLPKFLAVFWFLDLLIFVHMGWRSLTGDQGLNAILWITGILLFILGYFISLTG